MRVIMGCQCNIVLECGDRYGGRYCQGDSESDDGR